MFSPSRLIMKIMRDKKLMPAISATERQALEAGNVWFDGDVFAGKLRFKNVMSQPYAQHTAEEQAFIDGPCEHVCAMVDPWEVMNSRRIPEDAMQYLKDQGFLGLIIPKEFGGKGFSRLAVSSIMAKLMPHCSQLATVVIIANSLSASELYIHYGTPEQKAHYLPKLANGEYVPCFGLTELTAGSDAENIKATGVVFRDADGALKLRLNFEKRFMTLGSIANLATIACKVLDPENLLGKGEKIGITTVVVHRGTPGFHNGDHHLPIGAGFENGPLIGKDVIVSVDDIIGGRERAGQGWSMLMDQLAGGRGISLPAGAIGSMQLATYATAAFSMVRSQFGFQIGKMQGVEQKVGHMAALTYMFEATRVFLCTAIDNDIKPPVISGTLKAYSTQWASKVVADGMDVFAGAGVMQGPNNILGPLYQSAPVGITVEGANIMTFTFLINGQGATRCHPYSFRLVDAIEGDNPKEFRNAIFGWGGHIVVGYARSFIHQLTRGRLIGVPKVAPETKTYYRRLGRAAARFGMLTDRALMFIRADLKKEGKLNGRYADAFAWTMFATCALRRFEAEGRRPEDLPLVKVSVEFALAEVQKAYEGIYANFAPAKKKGDSFFKSIDRKAVGFFMRTFGQLGLRLNPLSLGPTDKDNHEAAQTIQTLDEQFKRLSEGVFIPDEDQPAMGRLMKAFRLRTGVNELLERISKAQRRKLLPRGGLDHELADNALAADVITTAEAAQLKEAHDACLEACQVDVFNDEQYYR